MRTGVEATAVVAGVMILLVMVILAIRRRYVGRGSGAHHHGAHHHGARHRGAPVTGGPSTAEVAAEASRALVQTDDAVLTSEQELGFAIAVFGERAMAPFSAAVDSARAERREAFRLRQILDDNPANETAARSLLTEICSRCSAASRLLDEQAEAFDEAHNLGARARQLVAEVDAHIAQQSARMSQSQQVLDRLARKYTHDAIVAVASNLTHAATRLEFAASCLAGAEQAVAARQTGTAAVLLQAAEAGADQATDLLTGVLHMEAELTQAASAVPAALREIDAEILDAEALLTGTRDHERSALVAETRAVSDDVRVKLASGAFDALVALRSLQQADAALDRALVGVRRREARRHRATAVLDEAMLVARSSVTAAEDFITTRRGGVGAAARTRLAEARRHFQQAIALSLADPEVALTEAQDADALAQQARALAEQDVAGFDYAEPSSEHAAAWSAWSAWAAHGGEPGLQAAVLGGILIDGQAGGIGPGSFGGVGTRGRHTVAARPVSATYEGGPCPSAASSVGLRS